MKKQLLSMLSVLFTATLVNAQEITSYRGAFAPAPTRQWTESWTNFDPQNTVYGATNVNVTGTISVNTTWTRNNVYLLQGVVYVASGVTLTIEPGTVIRGDNATPNSSLLIQRGGKLNAEGTQCNPIVFTSNKAVGSRAPGDWGGVIVLGNARNNGAGGTLAIEGLVTTDPRNQHGGTNDDDNSGVLKYVRIEYGGFVFAANNEINGLTMGSVGRGTTIDYVQASFVNDDAFEWFGGTVNCKHLVAYRCLDDDFDTDNGFSGTVQYALGVKDPAISDNPTVSTSEGFESDNDPVGTNESLSPKTTAKFYNVTSIGAFRCASNTNGSAVAPSAPGFRRGARIRRNSDLKIVNSIIMNHRRGLFLDGALTLGNIDQDSAAFRNNIIAGDFTTSFTYAAGNGVALAAEDAATRTRLFNPIYANDSINTCSLLTNAWDFVNADYRPNVAGAGAIVTDPANLTSGADLSPVIEIDGTLFNASQSLDFLVDVLENGTGASNGAIVINIFKPGGWNITFNPTATSSTVGGGTPVTNSNWIFTDLGTSIKITSKAGTVLGKGDFAQLGLTATRKATTPGGTNQSLNVDVSGGGDVTPANNSTITGFGAN